MFAKKTAEAHRHDIDLLRCVAIIGVVGYHYSLFGLSGGFVGVDVFFVVSGYLITEIVTTSIDRQRFTFSDFYERRARRLLPALFTTVLGVMIAAVVLSSPGPFVDIAKSSSAAMAGVSNILFYSQSGYFDTDAFTKPLLHTWSLAVEFQFYAIWPPLLWLMRDRSRGTRLVSVFAVVALSCAWSIFHVRVDRDAVFYLSPFRLWEFGAGAVVALLPLGNLTASLRLRALLSAAGFVTIVACCFAYTHNRLFPGASAIPPVLGAALVLAAGSTGGRALAFRSPMLLVAADLSYAIYLVHWPLLVLATGKGPSPLAAAGLIVATTLLALALNRLIEHPFRFRRILPARRAYLTFGGGAAAALIIVCGALSRGDGLWLFWVRGSGMAMQAINAFPASVGKDYVWSRYPEFEAKATFETNKPHVLLLGDSQSADLLNLFIAGGLDKNIEIATQKVFYECGSPYVPVQDRGQYWEQVNPITKANPAFVHACNGFMEQLEHSNTLQTADHVVIAYLWPTFIGGMMQKAVAEIRQRTHARVWLLGLKMLSGSSAELANRNGSPEAGALAAPKSIPPEVLDLNARLKQLASGSYFDMLSVVCPNGQRCQIYTASYAPTYWDNTHLTPDGAHYLWQNGAEKLFEPLLNRPER